MKFLIGFLLLCCSVSLLAQDMIITPVIDYKVTRCRVITADREEIKYSLPGDDQPKSIAVLSVVQINFDSAYDEIVQPVYTFDTLFGKIIAITSEEVCYLSDKRTMERILKSKVAACYFSHDCRSADRSFYDHYFQEHQDVQMVLKRNILIDRSGKQIDQNGIRINANKVTYNTFDVNGLALIESIDRKNIWSYVYSEFVIFGEIIPLKSYLLTQSGNLVECEIDALREDNLTVKIKTLATETSSEVPKTNICAIYFGEAGLKVRPD